MKYWMLMACLSSLIAFTGADAAAKVYRGRHVVRHFHMGPEDYAPCGGCVYEAEGDSCGQEASDGCPFSFEDEGVVSECALSEAEQRVRQPVSCRGQWYSQYASPHAERCRRWCKRCPLYDDTDIEDEYDVQASWPGKNETTWMRELNR